MRFALLLSLPLFAAVDGTVVNQTTGQLQPGVQVTLQKLSETGMQPLETVTTGPDGKFNFSKDEGGPALIQAVYKDINYTQMLQQGAARTGLSVPVYDTSAKQPQGAGVAQHMILFEPSDTQMIVSESYIIRNDSKQTWTGGAAGTLRFYLPDAAKGIVQVSVTAPMSVPVRRNAEKTSEANVWKVDFPVKPGESRADLTYLVPRAESFSGRILFQGGATRLVAPKGVTLSGEGLTSNGQEPRSQASIYTVAGRDFTVKIEGAGSLQASGGGEASEAPESRIEQVMPKVYGTIDGSADLIQKLLAVKWILALALAILTIGFVLLYRAQAPAGASPAKGSKTGK